MDRGRPKPSDSANQSRSLWSSSYLGQTTSRKLPTWRQVLIAVAIGGSIGIGSIGAPDIWSAVSLHIGHSCSIKGNISNSGERIYHVQTGEFYDVTRIDRLKGELWFCSEAEARAAGWRKSLR